MMGNSNLYIVQDKKITFDPEYNLPFDTRILEILSNYDIANKQDFETKNLVYLRYRERTTTGRGRDLVPWPLEILFDAYTIVFDQNLRNKIYSKFNQPVDSLPNSIQDIT